MTASAPERILQRLDWTVVRRLDGLLQGDYRSLFRGNGVDFADLREYQYGDDIRHIDWNVTARMDTPYVREFLEDREITAWFLLDLSPSVDFGSADSERLKRSVLVDFVTTLSRVLTRHGNRVGAVFYGARVERTIPARGGRVQVLRLINDLATHPRQRSAPFTDLSPLLDAGLRWIKGRSLVFVISDFISAPGWERSLRNLSRRHEVIAVRLYDPREMELPDVGPLLMDDAETGEQLYVDTHDPTFRRRYREAAEARETELRAAFRRAGVDAVSLSTGDDLLESHRPDGRSPKADEGVAMGFIWPPLLLLLLLVPLGVWAYRSRERRRAARAAQFGWGGGAAASAAGAAAGSGTGAAGTPDRASPSTGAARRARWVRRLPAIFTVAGVTILVFSLARPESVIGLPRLEGTVLLAFDVSGSMAATDVAPSRMEAAKAAALAFVAKQPPSVRIGVVVFSDTGFSTQVPGGDRPAVEAAIQRLEPERGTSLAQGIDASLQAIEAANQLDTTDYYSNRSPEPTPEPTPVPAGVFEPAIIVLLTDGENTVNADPLAAAQAAKDRGVRIDTVGIGTPNGATLEIEGFKVHTQLDAAALQSIAERTGGTYYAAADQADLSVIYDDVGSRLVVRSEPFELTPLFAGLGLTLLVIGGLASLRWFGRLP